MILYIHELDVIDKQQVTFEVSPPESPHVVFGTERFHKLVHEGLG